MENKSNTEPVEVRSLKTRIAELECLLAVKNKALDHDREGSATFALEFAKEAIRDAISSEDGLDGATGEAVLKTIAQSIRTGKKALAARPKPSNLMACGCEDGQHEPDCIEHPVNRRGRERSRREV